MASKLLMVAAILAFLPVMGEPVRIDENTTYTAQAQLDAAAADGIVIAEGVTLTLNPGKGKSLTADCVISGLGGVAVTSGTVTFNKPSTYEGGTAVSLAVVLCSVPDALGKGEVSIDGAWDPYPYVAYTQGSTTEGAAVVKNNFRLKNVVHATTGTSVNAALRFTSTTVGDRITFSGVVTCETGFSFLMNGGASKVATFTGGIVGPTEGGSHGMSLGGNTSVAGNNNRCIFDCVINAPTFKIRSTNGSFEFGFKQQGNVWLDLYNDRTTVTCYGENVLAADGDIVFASYYSRGTIELNGYSQVVRNLYDSEQTGENKTFTIRNSQTTKPATLTVKGTQDCDYLCYLQGKINLVWDPVGDYALTIKDFGGRADSGSMTMAGTVTAKAGRFVIDAGRQMPKLTGVSVEGSGRFVASKIDAIPVAAMSFAAAGDGVIDLPCETWLTASLTLGGEVLPSGYYAGSQLKPGVVVTKNLGERTMFVVRQTTEDVTPVPATWQGSGGNFSDPSNWQGGAPDFTTGTAKPTFAAGTTATVDGSYKIAGLTFGTADAYEFAAGDGALLEFSQGVTEIPAGATVIIDSPVRFAHGHRFLMGFNSVLKFLGKVSGTSVENVSFVSSETKSSTDFLRPLGVVHFVNDESDFVQDLSFTNTCLYVKGKSPLGGGLGSVTIRNEESFTTNDKLLMLDGATIGNPIRHDSNNANQKDSLYAYANTTNVLNGLFDLCEKSRYLTVATGAQVVFTGGLKYKTNNFYYTAEGSGEDQGIIIVRDRPMVFSGANFSNGSTFNSNLRLECAGNSLALCSFKATNARLTIAADDALTDTKLNELTKGTIDLNGHDAAFTTLGSTAPAGVVKSATPASLVLTGNSTADFNATFEGQAGLCVSGTGRITLPSAQASEGPLGADGQGALVLGESATWNGTNVVVKASGSLVLDNPTALKKRTTVTVFGTDWSILVKDGATATVRNLIDGETGSAYELGTYGGPNSAAAHKLANFGEGTGILNVTGVPGVLLIVR